MSEIKLTTASHLVLGLVEMAGPVTPYDLKNLAAQSVTAFWSLPHTQIYAQCDRLVEAGLISERREDDGRRRRQFTITAAGRKALDAWRATPATTPSEYRDEAILKLFFGADPSAIAHTEVERHEKLLAQYSALAPVAEGVSEGARLALECGLGHEREYLRFWRDIAKKHG